jgi:hypothetical protein
MATWVTIIICPVTVIIYPVYSLYLILIIKLSFIIFKTFSKFHGNANQITSLNQELTCDPNLPLFTALNFLLYTNLHSALHHIFFLSYLYWLAFSFSKKGHSSSFYTHCLNLFWQWNIDQYSWTSSIWVLATISFLLLSLFQASCYVYIFNSL